MNGGQTIKEFLAKNGIEAAKETKTCVRRKLLKLPGGEISHPTHKSVAQQKEMLKQKIAKGEEHLLKNNSTQGA